MSDPTLFFGKGRCIRLLVSRLVALILPNGEASASSVRSRHVLRQRSEMSVDQNHHVSFLFQSVYVEFGKIFLTTVSLGVRRLPFVDRTSSGATGRLCSLSTSTECRSFES